MGSYDAFLERKRSIGGQHGFAPLWMPDFLFDFQKALVDWSVRKGRAAIFADCGLGKTPMQLVWSENVVRKTGGRVLILTPLAVGPQTVAEGAKFGIEVERSRDGRFSGAIVVTNYEKLHLFSPADFRGVVCDESSILKHFSGATQKAVTRFMLKIPYRLLCTATAAPNDYIELGTSSEALGELGHVDMLNRFFVNDQNTVDLKARWKGHAAPRVLRTPGWRFKGHAETAFWRWVCSWARACRKPSDLGFDNDGFVLPPLVEREHTVETRSLPPGMLFQLPATNFAEEREERRRTINERCEMADELVSSSEMPAVVWCHLNAEGDLLERLIRDSKQVKGSTSDDEKEAVYEAFSSGDLRVLVIKPKIGAWGLNWQHCSHVVSFASHSYEQYYQAVRRCWRFGQRQQVIVDLVSTEGERHVRENLRRKSEAADQMFSSLVAHMNDAMRIEGKVRYEQPMEIPTWLSATSV